VWRDRDFRLFYGGQAVSMTGSAVSRIAIPLLGALSLHAGPLGLAALQACEWAPYLGLPLLAGVYLDRHRRRPVLIAANAVQAVLLGLIPLLAWAGLLTLPIACAVAFGSGVGAVFFAIGVLAYLPDLVGRDRLLGANAAVEATRNGADVLGRGLGGAVVQALGAPLAVLLDAVSYLVSVVTLAWVRRPEADPPPVDGRAVLPDLAVGLRFVFGQRGLRALTGWLFSVNGLWQAFTVPYLLYALHDRHIGAGLWGVVLAASGVAALLGSTLAPRLATRLGYGPTIVISAVVSSAPLVLVPAAGGGTAAVVSVWIIAEALAGLATGVANVLLTTLRTQVTPPPLLARVASATRQLSFGAIPLGSLVGGVLAGALGNRPTLWLLPSLMILANVILAPVWRLRTLHAWQVPESSSSAA
jgi:MFS family permease